MAKRAPLPPKIGHRASASKELLPRIWVLTEGKNTEPGYVKAFAAHSGNAAVKVEILPAIGTPMTIVRECLKRKKQLSRSGEGSRDQIWAVFDRDTHPDIEQAINAADQGGVYIAYSNPCFELWAILHHAEHDAPLDSASAQKKLSELMPCYSHKKSAALNFDKLNAGYASACARAVRMRKRRSEEGSPRQNPFTNVDELTIAISGFGQPDKNRALAKGRKLAVSERT